MEKIRWRQRGAVYLWRYTENQRNYPGWHLTADPEGCAALLALMDAFLAAPYSCRQIIQLSQPDESILAVPNNRHGQARWVAADALILQFPKLKAPPRAWSLTADAGCVTLVVGEGKLRLVREGISGVPHGLGDYEIGPDDQGRFDQECLWFWWFPQRAGSRSRRRFENQG